MEYYTIYVAYLTFVRRNSLSTSSFHLWLHLGQVFLLSQNLHMMDCRMEANGVTPMPVAMSTACWARNTLLAGAPKGPSM